MSGSGLRLGVMQPYFFPHLAHFALIEHTDAWIVFDVTQYTPKTWMSRNRVLHPSTGWNWINVPLANGSIHIRTHEARLLDPQAARDTVLGKLSHYRRKAPFHHTVERLVHETFDGPADEVGSLTHLNRRGLAAVCRHLGLRFESKVCSTLDLGLPEHLEAGDWALEICGRLGATAYLNPVGGRALFDPARYRERGIALQFLEMAPFAYATSGYAFEPGLSILDVMMWNEPAAIVRALREGSALHDA
jgi:hypothetical protein